MSISCYVSLVFVIRSGKSPALSRFKALTPLFGNVPGNAQHSHVYQLAVLLWAMFLGGKNVIVC